MIPTRLNFIGPIVKFLYRKAIKKNKLLLSSAVLLGLIGRFLVLVGFAVTLQAIVAAISPEVIFSYINKVLRYLGMNFTIESIYVIHILISVIIIIFGVNWIVQTIRSHLIGRLNLRIIDDNKNYISDLSVDDDVFIIEHIPPVVEAVEKCCEISMFMILIIGIISIMAPILSLLLLPVLLMLVMILIFGDRSRLIDLHNLQVARRMYMNHFDEAGGASQRRLYLEDGEERETFVNQSEKIRHQKVVKPQADAFVGSIALSVVIYYLSFANLDKNDLAGLLIIFVVGIRYVIVFGRELGVNISRILELRKGSRVLDQFLSNS